MSARPPRSFPLSLLRRPPSRQTRPLPAEVGSKKEREGYINPFYHQVISFQHCIESSSTIPLFQLPKEVATLHRFPSDQSAAASLAAAAAVFCLNHGGEGSQAASRRGKQAKQASGRSGGGGGCRAGPPLALLPWARVLISRPPPPPPPRPASSAPLPSLTWAEGEAS